MIVKYGDPDQHVEKLSATFAALADPTRLGILQRLAAGEASVADLSEPFPISAPAISRHLKVLENAGLISRGRNAQWRPCRLEGAPLREVSDWVEQYRKIWEERFDRLDDYLQKLQSNEKKSNANRRTNSKKRSAKKHGRKKK